METRSFIKKDRRPKPRTLLGDLPYRRVRFLVRRVLLLNILPNNCNRYPLQEEAKQEEDHKVLPQSCEEIEGYLRLRMIRAAVPLSLNTNSEMAS